MQSIILEIKSTSLLKQKVTLFNASANLYAANFGNPNFISIKGNMTYKQLLEFTQKNIISINKISLYSDNLTQLQNPLTFIQHDVTGATLSENLHFPPDNSNLVQVTSETKNIINSLAEFSYEHEPMTELKIKFDIAEQEHDKAFDDLVKSTKQKREQEALTIELEELLKQAHQEIQKELEKEKN